MKTVPYTNLQFNSLPGWARDHILALEGRDVLPTLSRMADSLSFLAHNLSFHKEEKLQILAKCAKDAADEACDVVAKH